jgi:peroxin-14
MAALRDDMLKSAVSFLSDPKVQSAPLAKKIAFLESKGMTSEEIEEAMARVNGKSAAVTTTTTTAGPVAYPAGVMQAPPVPARASYDWRDVFIATVMAGSVGYGVWHLAKVRSVHQERERETEGSDNWGLALTMLV